MTETFPRIYSFNQSTIQKNVYFKELRRSLNLQMLVLVQLPVANREEIKRECLHYVDEKQRISGRRHIFLLLGIIIS